MRAFALCTEWTGSWYATRFKHDRKVNAHAHATPAFRLSPYKNERPDEFIRNPL